MSLIYGSSYLKEYSITGDILVVLDDAIIWIILLLRDILNTRIFLWSY